MPRAHARAQRGSTPHSREAISRDGVGGQARPREPQTRGPSQVCGRQPGDRQRRRGALGQHWVVRTRSLAPFGPNYQPQVMTRLRPAGLPGEQSTRSPPGALLPAASHAPAWAGHGAAPAGSGLSPLCCLAIKRQETLAPGSSWQQEDIPLLFT